ncbi:unnamed protein product [Psylliodes chrysocephalus]|uniref:E3 ubiquitin-protein ligase NRDP1 n=1 Tax=Psylliodes chrysocephalus TaxID=3402493 RepID=A0A9P0D6W5_9CUCU|nr:unnamed protein product [Psylliodes chrysocephala]
MGFELNRFQGEVDEELVCPICSEVLEDPIQAPVCEHTFCKTCITEWISRQPTCPVDRQILTSPQLRQVPRIIRNLLSRLCLTCDNAQYGCTRVLKLDALPAHLEECEHNPKRPLPCEQGCGLIIPKDELKDHNCVKELRALIHTQQQKLNEFQQEINEQRFLLAEQRREMQLLKDFMRAMRISNPSMRAIADAMERDEVLRWSNSLQRARVTRWGGMISTPDEILQRMIKRTLTEMGCPPHILDDLMENCHERRWPPGLCSLETRQNNRRQYENYICKRVPGKQAVMVLSCDNVHMGEDMMVEPGLFLRTKMTVQQYCLRWNNHQPNFISVFSSLLSSQCLVDVTLAAEGKQLQAHKVVLSACSSYFQSLFATNPCKHPIVILKDVKFLDLRVMVDFMYHGEVSVSQEQLPCILKTAEMLKIKGLTEIPMENPAAKCQSQTTEKTEMTQSTETWSLDENRPLSPSSPSSKRRRLKKNVICNPTITTESAEGTSNEILLSSVDNVFEAVLKTEESRSLEESPQKYNGIPVSSIQPSTSHHREAEQPVHQIITQVTPPEDINTSQHLECSPVEMARTCPTSQPTTVTYSPRSSQSPPPQEIQHMGPKRGRFLMRQSRIKREPDLCQEAEVEPAGLSQYLTVPTPLRIERQCSEPIPSISTSPDNLLHVPEHVLVKQHSHPILPSKSTESSTRSSHCPVIRHGPALGCNFCWNTVDTHGRILRRKTKYHCPECETNLCIVPCFQEYHKTQATGDPPNPNPILPSPTAKVYPKSM